MNTNQPIEYSFKCGRCGMHKVTEKTFDAHVTPAVRDKIAEQSGVKKARLVFKDSCPVCLPQNVTHTRVADVEVSFGRTGQPVAHITP